VPLVRAPGRDPDLPTSTLLGGARVRALHASLRGGPSRQGGKLTLADRAQLLALLTGSGLPAEGAARVAADAAWGILLVPGPGESRIGGRPVLADAWPLTADGRPLTHLATLALAELPDVEGREVLPDSGYLSFFADLEDEEALYDEIGPGDELADRRAVIHTDAGGPTREPDGPSLEELRVRPTARLQLRPVGFGSAKRWYGLDAVGERVLEGIDARANGTVPHQLLGFPATVQDDPREQGETSLLHLVQDGRIGFSFLDAGSVHFFAAPDDVRARRWDQVTLWPSSC